MASPSTSNKDRFIALLSSLKMRIFTILLQSQSISSCESSFSIPNKINKPVRITALISWFICTEALETRCKTTLISLDKYLFCNCLLLLPKSVNNFYNGSRQFHLLPGRLLQRILVPPGVNNYEIYNLVLF